MSKFLPTLIILAVAGGLGFYVTKYEQTPLSELAVPKVVETERDKIVKVVLEDTAKKEAVTLEKKDGGWKITAPLAADTDEGEVDSLLDRLEKVKADRIVEKPEAGKSIDLVKYGLDAPGHRIVWSDGAAERTLEIGKDSPLGANAYVKLAGDDKIFLVNSGDLQPLKKGLFAFRDKTILEATKDDVQELTVSRAGGETWRFVNRGDGTWSIAEPFEAAGDAKAIGDLVNDLGRLRAEEFTAESAEELKQYGLADPEVSAKLVMKADGATKAVHFGSRKEGDSSRVYVKRETRPNVYLADSQLIKGLSKSIDELRDKTVFQLGGKELVGLSVEKQGAGVTARRQDGGWLYENPRTAREPGTAGTLLSDKLKSLQAVRFVRGEAVNETEFGLDKPDYRLVVTARATPATTAETAVTTEIAAIVGKPADSGRYMRIEGSDVVVVTKEDITAQMDGFHRTYLEVLPFDVWNVKSVTLSRGETTRAIEIDDKGDWKAAGQEKATSPLKDRAREFVATLPRLVPERWMADAKPAELGLDEPALKAAVRTKDGKSEATLLLSERGGAVYLAVEGQEGAGVVKEDVLKKGLDLMAAPVAEEPPAPVEKSEAPAPAEKSAAPDSAAAGADAGEAPGEAEAAEASEAPSGAAAGADAAEAPGAVEASEASADGAPAASSAEAASQESTAVTPAATAAQGS